MEDKYRQLLIDRGVNVDDAIIRCNNNEAFFIKLIKIFFRDTDFEKLEADLISGDYDAAYPNAHSIKGMSGNIGIESIYDKAVQIVALLKKKETEGVWELFSQMKIVYEDLKEVVEDL